MFKWIAKLLTAPTGCIVFDDVKIGTYYIDRTGYRFRYSIDGETFSVKTNLSKFDAGMTAIEAHWRAHNAGQLPDIGMCNSSNYHVRIRPYKPR